MDWGDFFSGLGQTAIWAGAAAFILRGLFTHVLSRDLERFSKDLETRRDMEVERLRAELQATQFERQTPFAHLHERRAEVIVDLNKRLVRTQRELASLVHPLQEAGEPPIAEKAKVAAEAGNAFNEFFNENRIFLDEPLCERIDELSRSLFHAWRDFNPQDHRSDVRMKAWQAAWKRMEEEIPPIRREIETRLREILGVTEPTETPDSDS
jgi:hypothetical protein